MVDSSSRQKPTSQSVPNLGAMGTYAVIPENSATANGMYMYFIVLNLAN